VKALVVGGGGYLGSHIVRGLLAGGHGAVAVDNFCSGHRELLPKEVPVFACDAGLMVGIEDVLRQHPVDVVIYCAGLCDSVQALENPFPYYHNNFIAVFYLLQTMLWQNVRRFLFSTDFSVYGSGPAVPITEKSPRHPEDPLGKSLCAVEDLLADLAVSGGLGYAVMRVGNVAGAVPAGELGPWPKGSRRLLAMALDVALELREFLPVHGAKLPTADGSPVRDYVHVCDVVDAYLSAAGRIPTRGGECYLLGTGRPVSVLQVAQKVEEITHRPIPIRVEEMTGSRPASAYADAARTRRELHWSPRHDLTSIVESEWRWRLGKGSLLAKAAD
jgi:UDP-glucose 4-epimerase